MISDFALDVQQPISSVDLDANGKLVVIGGRESLKLLEFNIDKAKVLDIKLNLRKQGIKQPIGYLEFNRSNNWLVAASVQGTFSIWDMQAHGQSYQVHMERQHSAAIHRMNWRNESQLASGGQDCLINVYDVREKELKVAYTGLRSNPIRDVKFNPMHNEYLMAAYETGLLEYFDIRKLNEPVSIMQNAHNNLIICLDWNTKQQNVFASGSNEKEIKIWQVMANSDIEERVKIQHIDGSSHLKWHKQSPNLLSVASLNRDTSVTVYDIYQPYRPQIIIKGHTETITSFVFTNDEQSIITASKDKTIRLQSLENSYKVYDKCPRYPLAMNQFNDLIFKLEQVNPPHMELQERTSFDDIPMYKPLSAQSQAPISSVFKRQGDSLSRHDSQFSGSQYTFTNIDRMADQFFIGQRNIWNPRSICIMDNITPSKITIEEEINQFQLNYVSTKDISFDHNSKVALQYLKPEIAQYWMGLKHLIADFQTLLKEANVNVLKNSRINIANQKKIDDTSDDELKSPLLELPTRKPEVRKPASLDMSDLTKLYKYFERYPAAFRQELECKNIMLMDKNQLRIKIERVPYYQRLLKTQAPISQLLTTKDTMLRCIADSIYDLIQYVIDLGELPTGFWMFACAKHYVCFQDNVVEKWTQSYLELLLAFQHYSSTVRVVQECPIDAIKLSNRSAVQYVCQKCLNEFDKPYCTSCHVEPICIICQGSVKGLYLWCQGCQHGGHSAELKKWFSTNDHCPSGCGHVCFKN